MEEKAIWIEKYRPKDFSEFRGQEKIVERIKAFVKNKNIPHLLFAGPAGTGKTTLALIIAKKLFQDSWHENFLETNASDERGIDVIRVKIKDFSRTMSLNTDVPKIVYLDEADALTKEAQQALRRTMEQYSSTTRFILSCNYSSKIIDPIQSRCTVFRFKPLEKEDIAKIIEEISKKEKIKVTKEAIEALYEISEGDARKVENLLQSCSSVTDNVTEKIIFDVVSAAKPKEVKQILEIALKGDFLKARSLLLQTMLQHGLSGLDIIKQIQKQIWDLEIEDKKKIFLIEKCGEVEFRMVEGSDEFLQLESLLASFIPK